MTRTSFVNRLAILSRRKALASALVYGLSLSIRFTSATGEEIEIPPQSMQAAGASIATGMDAHIPYRDWTAGPVQPVALRQGWLLRPQGCRTACRPDTPLSPPDCP